jgi:ABC-type phosphate transport system substrate-binding protein
MFRLRLFPSTDLRAIKLTMGCFAVGIGVILLLSLTNEVIAAELTVKLSESIRQNSRLSREQLREIFFARQTRWPDGKPVRAFVLPDQHPLHIRFSKEILGVYPYQLRAAWDRMIYSGTGVPPAVVESVEEMRKKIEETPGGIGYIEEQRETHGD